MLWPLYKVRHPGHHTLLEGTHSAVIPSTVGMINLVCIVDDTSTCSMSSCSLMGLCQSIYHTNPASEINNVDDATLILKHSLSESKAL